jgi:large subunit ribosomal protein LX
MKNFEIKGTFRENKEGKKFSKTINALNENTAREKTLSIMGSKHKVKRIHIKIESIKESKE